MNRKFFVAGALLLVGHLCFAAGLTPQQREWLEQNGRHADILKLETDLMRALVRKDKAWMDATANAYSQKNGALLERIANKTYTKQEEALIVSMGPCHYAHMTLNGMIIVLSETYTKAGSASNPSKRIPIALRQQFAESMRTCELVKDIPHSQRKFNFEE